MTRLSRRLAALEGSPQARGARGSLGVPLPAWRLGAAGLTSSLRPARRLPDPQNAMAEIRSRDYRSRRA
jgi:hypothetical protein